MRRSIFDADHESFRDTCAAVLQKSVAPHLESCIEDRGLTREP